MADKIPPQSIASIYSLPQPPLKKAETYLTEGDQTWVYSAVRLIATNLAEVELRLFKRKMKAKEWVIDEVLEHEALSLIQNPNPFYTGDHLLKLTTIYRELTGEAYWVFVRNGEKIVQIWPLRPDWVKVKASKKNFIEKYTYGPISGQEVEFDVKDILAFKDPNPSNPYRGKGAVQAASLVIDIDNFSDEWNRNFFYNSALPYIIFKSEEIPADEEKKRFLQEVQNKFGGRKNAHKVLALWGKGWNVERFGETIAELDFINSKNMLRDEILAAFHLSKANLGVVEDVNRANQEASNRRFQRDVILPRMRSFVTHLNQFYLPNWDEDIFFDFDNPVPEDTERKLALYKNALGGDGGAPWMTINEIRELENLPPAENGDQLFMPFTLTPVGGVKGAIRGFFGKSKDKEEGMITLKVKGKKKRKFMIPIPPRKLADLRKEQAEKKIKTNLYELANLIVREVHSKAQKGEKVKKGKKTVTTLSDEQQKVFWKQMVAKTDVYEDKMKELLRRVFSEQEEEVLNRLEEKRDFLGRTKALNLFPPLKEEIKRWLGVFSPFVREIVLDKGREIFGFLGAGGPELDLSTSRATRYLATEGLAFVTQCNETTRDQLKKTLAEGLDNNEGIPKLRKRVEDVFIEARGRRSEMIARTEVLKSTNFATSEAYRQSGVVKKKQWLVAYDERTCEHCLAMEGKITDTAGIFKSPLGNVEEPPLHVMCRCTTIPVFE